MILKIIPENGFFIDVGANISCFTIPIAKKISKNGGRVFSIEASPYVYRYLLKNIELSKLQNITVFNKAASSQIGSLSLYESNRSSFGCGSLLAQNDCLEKIFVDSLTLDYLLNDFEGIIDVIKIDVECFEYLVIDGASQLLKSGRVRMVIFEFFYDAESVAPNYKAGDSQRLLKKIRVQNL